MIYILYLCCDLLMPLAPAVWKMQNIAPFNSDTLNAFNVIEIDKYNLPLILYSLEMHCLQVMDISIRFVLST